jgi:predicted nucleic acid-binding protein
MNVFIDANIIVSVFNKEYPLFTYTSRILSLADSKEFQIFTSPVCLAIAFYFAEKKFNSKIAKQKVGVLCDHVHITNTGQATTMQAITNATIHDFEDGLEYYSAIESNCTCIITEDTNDFYFAEIEVLNSRDFFAKYMVNKQQQ